MAVDDRQLIERLLNGEQSAFNEFFASYFNRLFRFARTRLSNDEAAADVVQDTLSRALRHLSSYRGEAALFTWLCQICRSQLSDYYERHHRHAKRFVPVEDDPAIQAALDSMIAPDVDPQHALQREETSRLVQLVLDRLPARYGNALEWKYVEGASVEEIAARLGVQHAAAQSVLQRAREAFRTMFRELHGDLSVLHSLDAGQSPA